MATLPDTQTGKIAFFSTRINDWNDNAAVIGLTSEQIAAFLTTRINPATDALEAARVAREAAKAATIAANRAIKDMTEDGRGLVAIIQANAKNADDPTTVYEAARLPLPNPPSPRPEPEVPTAVTGFLASGGGVVVSWQGQVIGRSFFEIDRSVIDEAGQQGPWQRVDSTPERTTRDDTVPPGARSATYRVRGRNTTGTSDWSVAATVAFNAAPTQQPAFTLRSTVGRAA